MLYVSAEGAHSSTYVPQADHEPVEKANRRYQRFRKARAALAKLGKQSLALVDTLQQTLTEPYPPPERALRSRRGRRRRGSGMEDSH